MAGGAIVLLAGWWASRRRGDLHQAWPIPGERDRVTVEVLNGSGETGLARATTRHLRRSGIDVVSFGTALSDSFQVSRVLVRRGDSAVGLRVRDALGAGTVSLAPDPDLLVDVSVILGADLVGAIHLPP